MPVSYQFWNTETKHAQSLADIDNEMCVAFGRSPRPTQFSIEYSIIVNIGIDCCGDGKFSERRFQELTAHLEPDMVKTLQHFLLGKYEFRAWR